MPECLSQAKMQLNFTFDMYVLLYERIECNILAKYQYYTGMYSQGIIRNIKISDLSSLEFGSGGTTECQN